MNRYEKGKLGEDTAEEYLIKQGFRVLERCFKCKAGEIDIVAEKDGDYYFIEVKTRWSSDYGNPLESVTYAKQKQVIKAAKFYLAKKRLADAPCHLSAIGIDIAHGEADIEFIEDAFEV